MNLEIRKLFEQLSDVLNNNKSPMEAKRLVLFILLEITEKKADNLVNQELSEMLEDKIKSDKEGEDAESIYKNKLEKLSK